MFYLSWHYSFDLLGGFPPLPFYPWLRGRRLYVESTIPVEIVCVWRVCVRGEAGRTVNVNSLLK